MLIVLWLLMALLILVKPQLLVGFGLSAVVLLDSAARAFSWLGVRDPATAWLLLGLTGGLAVGAWIGLRRGGQRVSRAPAVALGLASFAGLVAAGAPFSAAPSTASRRAERGVNNPRAMRVFAEELSVRTRPARGARAVGTVSSGEQVVVVGRTADGGWYQIDGTAGGRQLRGWVSSRYVARPTWEVTVTDGRATSARAAATTGGTAGGEVGLPGNTPPDPTADGAGGGPVDPAPNAAAADSAAPPPAAPAAPPREAPPSGGYQPLAPQASQAEQPDQQLVADVAEGLRNARASAATNDFPSALRALAAADEAVTIAAARYGSTAWVGALRRDAAGARRAVRASCLEAAATVIGSPPRCD